ncbi:MAG TPA: PQQ-binding-like beta-propeller repeat protein [Rhizomicrobium sp.]
MTFPRNSLLGLALAGALVMSIAAYAAQAEVGSAGAARPIDPLAPPPPDLAKGASLYQQRCASCHDNPTGRIPARAVIEDNTRAFIVSVLAEGVMKPMAPDLSWSDVGSLASYLAKRQGGGVATTALESPLCTFKPAPLSLAGPHWNGWGADGDNTRFQPEPGLTAKDIPRLKVKWAFHHAGGRSGQATIVGGRVFVNSSSGSIYSLDARTGCAWWRFEADAGSRTSIVVGALPPAMAPARYAAYFADQSRHVYAIDAESGRLLWKTPVDNQSGVQMTGSLMLNGGRLYVPVSSAEEAMAANDAYECCKFRGALVAVDAVTGKVLWKTYTTAAEPKPFKKNAKGTQMYGPAGGAIWSAPTIDAKRRLVYVTTGDSYTDVPYDGADAVMALDMDTGAVRWVNQVTPGDDYIIGCYGLRSVANCPTKVGADADFGASPILRTLADGKQVILAGQKSSDVYALDPDKQGAILWHHRLSGGGPLGGVEFGPAADGQNFYVALSDIFTGPLGKPGLIAIRIADGAILWNTPASKPAVCAWKNVFCDPALSQAITAIPGIVFAGSMDGHFRAYDTVTGSVVWDVDTAITYQALGGREVSGGGLDGAGPTVAGGMVYVTSGYQGRSGGVGSVLLAYSVDGK